MPVTPSLLAIHRNQLRTLANDIKAHGLQVPVTTYEGKSLMGGTAGGLVRLLELNQPRRNT